MNNVIRQVHTALLLCREAITGKEKQFTTGSVNRSIVLLAVPMVLELVMESLFVFVSLYYVSRLGASGISVVGTTESVATFTFSIGTGLTIAASALIARRVGEQNLEEAGLTAMQIVWVALLLGIGISAAGAVFAKEILETMGLPSGLIAGGLIYARIMFAGTCLLILRMAINGILRGAGNATATMKTLWISNLSNILLCPLLMFGFGPLKGYGIAGIAIAAVLSRTAGIIFQLWLFIRKKTVIAIKRSSMKVDVLLIKKILRLTLGGTIQYLVPSSSWLLMVKIVSMLGTQPLAAYIIAQRISSVTTIPVWGIGNAAGTLTGQNLGAGAPERAEETVWKAGKINMIFLCLIAIAWIFMAGPVVSCFTTDPEIKRQSIMYLHFISFAYILLGYTMVISRALNAAGKIKTVTLLYLAMFYVLQLPLAYLLGIVFRLDTTGIFSAILISEIFLSIACIYIFKKGNWKIKKI